MVSHNAGAEGGKMPPPFVVRFEIQDGSGVGEEAAGFRRDRRPQHELQRRGGRGTEPVVKWHLYLLVRSTEMRRVTV